MTRTLKNLKALSHDELEVIMIELREKVEDQCEWGSGMHQIDPRFKINAEEARDLSLDTKYLENKHDLIEYIRKADKVPMRKQLIETMYNFTY